jgi:pentatricopeptide repeat protein
VALPLVRGIVAFVAADYAGALACFEPIVPQFHRIGGSHAQWELFEETMVVCYIKLGRYEDAVRLLRRRLAGRRSPRDLAWLSGAEEALSARSA